MLDNVAATVAVRPFVVLPPATVTEPIAKPPLLSRTVTVPVLAAKVVIAVSVSVNENVPPAPNKDNPLALTAFPTPLSVIVPPTVSNSTFRPTASRPLIENPVSSLKVKSPPKDVVNNLDIALFTSFKSNVPFSSVNVAAAPTLIA